MLVLVVASDIKVGHQTLVVVGTQAVKSFEMNFVLDMAPDHQKVLVVDGAVGYSLVAWEFG